MRKLGTEVGRSRSQGALGFERLLVTFMALVLVVGWLVGERAAQVSLQVAGKVSVPASGGWAAVLAIVLAIFLNALYVAAETSMELLSSLHIKHAAGSVESEKLQRLSDHRQKYVAACSMGSQIARLCLIFLGFLLAPDVAIWFDSWFGWPITSYGTLVAAAVLVSIVVVLVNLVVAELVPKSYGALHPPAVSLRLYGFIRVTSFLLAVPAHLVVAIADRITARFGGRASFSPANQAEEQIKTLVDSAQETGEIEVDERELLHSVFEFSDTVCREVMTPRVDLDAMPITAGPDELVKLIQETGHSRIPIYEETDDQIVGVVHAKDLLLAMVESPGSVNVRDLIRGVLFVPENKSLSELLTDMRMNRTQLAVVQDEFGGTAGIVTTEDIVEELVGDIVDEYDEEEADIVPVGDHTFLVEGRTHVDDVNDRIGSDFSSEEFDTIGGFVFGLFGRQPKEGEVIEHDGYQFTVAVTDGRRIEQLRIAPGPVDSEAEPQ